MTYKVQGIILAKKDIRDVDRHFVVYTLQRGKIEVLAKGARKIESKLSGNLELLNHVLCTLGKGRALDRVATVDIIDHFQPIKDNFFSLSAALYCFEIFNSFVKWEERDESLFLLLVDFLEALKKARRASTQQTLAHLFLLKCSYLLGLGDMHQCLEDIHRRLIANPLADCAGQMGAREEVKMEVHRFVQRVCDTLPRSQCYFDLLSPSEKVTV